ncbi:flagellar FlbD family protein [Clostridium botulinum]|uniref:Flagellar protein FlbD n=3 Tax=Clostridium botulinum TaxID=1491 RepID=C1FU52_CLOBJ|nr:flagellar FlbD family protein [Clostridium botulinum]EKX78648.1 flagellar protein FlbD [Clostridium botulinum CFSAN001628]ACA45502.1 flagellar protein FlbD [Clostridium botulinum B1 str. Okra]ACO83488.1 flagellar protein FlbD [Clostridium botulinum A2 str. Kyoto]AUN07799.1 endoflagellar protein [Clostridium botulinum]MBD5562138.1 flagellar FlbD family protein [Clostridium botulinum]
MIQLTGMNREGFTLNAEHIEKIEQVPESLITLVNGKKYIVIETPNEIIEKVKKYKSDIITLGIQGEFRK